MDVGMMMVFASYGWDDCSDEEIRLARLPLRGVGRGLKLFAKEVLPALKAQASAEVKAAAE